MGATLITNVDRKNNELLDNYSNITDELTKLDFERDFVNCYKEKVQPYSAKSLLSFLDINDVQTSKQQ